MGIDQATLRAVRELVRPIAKRVANVVARAVVQLVDDAKKLQLLQVGALPGETLDAVEHHQPYGFSSVPLPGAEAMLVFPNGDRGHAIALAASHRQHRPTGGQAGEVCMYTDEGDVVRLGRGHIISLATTGEVRLGSASAAQAAIKGTQRNTAEQTFLTALNAYVVAIQPPADPGNIATPTLTAAINTFKTAIANALSAKVKLE